MSVTLCVAPSHQEAGRGSTGTSEGRPAGRAGEAEGPGLSGQRRRDGARPLRCPGAPSAQTFWPPQGPTQVWEHRVGGDEQKVDLVTWCSQDSRCDRVRGSDHEAITSLGPLVSWTPPQGVWSWEGPRSQ